MNMTFRTTWYQFLGKDKQGTSFCMFLGTDEDVDEDKVKEVSRDKPTKKILKKLGVPGDLISDCLKASENVCS